MSKHYDYIVVGAGSGTKIAHYAADHGKKVAFIEQGPFGGTCVNRGCVPSKMLIYPADQVCYQKHLPKLNLHPKGLEIHYRQIVERETSTVDEMADNIVKHYKRLDHLDVYAGHAAFIDRSVMQVGDETITAERFYLVLGARPRIPSIEGLENTPYLTSTEALRLKKQPKSLVIIGGGFIGAELGHFFQAMGTETTILTHSKFVNRIDEEIGSIYKEVFCRNVRVQESVNPSKVSYEKGEFTVECESGESFKSEALLVAAGLQGNGDSIGLENTEVQVDEKGFIQVDETLKTDAPNIWAYGDCIGHPMFRHTANFQGDYLRKSLFGDPPPGPIDYRAVPYAVFTEPQLAVAGKTETELRQEGVEYVVGKAEMKNSDMGIARAIETGMVKLLFERKSRRLLSAHIVGEDAATMIHIPIAYIRMGAKLDDITDTIFIHPAFPEVVSSAAYDARNHWPENK